MCRPAPGCGKEIQAHEDEEGNAAVPITHPAMLREPASLVSQGRVTRISVSDVDRLALNVPLACFLRILRDRLSGRRRLRETSSETRGSEPSGCEKATPALGRGLILRFGTPGGTEQRPAAERTDTATASVIFAPSQAALPTCGCAQWAHRRASIGISLRHSEHFLVVGSAGAGSLRIRATSAFTGVTTKK